MDKKGGNTALLHTRNAIILGYNRIDSLKEDQRDAILSYAFDQ